MRHNNAKKSSAREIDVYKFANDDSVHTTRVLCSHARGPWASGRRVGARCNTTTTTTTNNNDNNDNNNNNNNNNKPNNNNNNNNNTRNA